MHMHASVEIFVLGAFFMAALLGCTPAATVEVAPGGLGRLSVIDTVQVADAKVEKGTGVSTDIRSELAGVLAGRLRAVTVEVVVDGEAGETGSKLDPMSSERLILVYRRSDFLPDYQRRQSNERWYWWGLLLDSRRGRVATVHGEMEKETGDPEERFSKELKRLLRDARKLRP